MSNEKEKAESLNVSYLAFESSQARMERFVMKLWIVILALILCLIATNIGWIWYECQWQCVQTTTTIDAQQDGSGVNIIGNGDEMYGEESKDYSNNNK